MRGHCSQGRYGGVRRQLRFALPFVLVGLLLGQAVALARDQGPAGAWVGDTAGTRVLFDPATMWPLSPLPWDVDAADFDGDGDVDLVCPGRDTVTVLWGNGSGAFAVNTRLAVGRRPLSVRVGDLDHDGRSDIVVANELDDSGSVSVILNLGGRAFARQDYRTGRYPWWVILADFKGDGYLDIATANRGSSGTLSVLLNDGHGAFPSRVDTNAPGDPMHIAAGDLNGDGKQDLVVGYFSSPNLGVLLGKGDGTFEATKYYYADNSWSVAVADMNQDGKLDVVAGCTNAAGGDADVKILLGDGKGGLGLAQSYPVRSSIWTISIGDVDNDGKPDVVAACDWPRSEVAVLLGNGDGTLQLPAYFPTGKGAGAAAIRDLNADGWADLAVATKDTAAVTVLINETRLTPVQLSGLQAEPGEGFVDLRWSVYAEGIAGPVQVSRADRVDGAYAAISGPLDVALAEHQMTYRDGTVQPGRDYYYKITLGSASQGPLHVRTAAARLALSVAGANPFRETTELRYSLPAADRVRIVLLDAQGRLMRRLLDEMRPAGWGRVPVNAAQLPAGIYFARLDTKTGSRSVRIASLK
jgi:hypothetical protein